MLEALIIACLFGGNGEKFREIFWEKEGKAGRERISEGKRKTA